MLCLFISPFPNPWQPLIFSIYCFAFTAIYLFLRQSDNFQVPSMPDQNPWNVIFLMCSGIFLTSIALTQAALPTWSSVYSLPPSIITYNVWQGFIFISFTWKWKLYTQCLHKALGHYCLTRKRKPTQINLR